MQIMDQTCYNLQYITTSLSGYMSAPTELAFLACYHDMEYLM